MKLKSLRVQNIACFEDITLDFTHPETGDPCPWVVLLGENGVGKSTLMQMIAVAFLGPSECRGIGNEKYWSRFLREVSHPGEILIDIQHPSSFDPDGTEQSFILGTGLVDDAKFPVMVVDIAGYPINYIDGETPKSSFPIWFSSGYGSRRNPRLVLSDSSDTYRASRTY